MPKDQLFPKILLLEHSFNNSTGMGITLTNLFNDWPKSRIGVMSDDINVGYLESIRPCSLYIGISKNINPSARIERRINVCHNGSLKSRVRKVYYNLGLNEILGKSKILPNNIESAKSFAPDIVFCSLGTLNRMRVCESIIKAMPETHLVIYIVDDWINSRVIEKKPTFFWKRLFHRSFKRLLQLSSGNLSICETMSQAYLQQFGKQFVPFHNPVDVQYWSNLSFERKYPEGVVSLLYVGKINEDTEDCLVDCAKCVESLNLDGKEIVFDVFSPDFIANQRLFESYSHCHLFPAIPHEKIPELTKSYDSLLLTLGFSKKTIQYIKLSMPTKLSEYLASGLPIVLYCPSDIALTNYVQSKDCAFCCTEKSIDKLRDTLLQLFNNSKVQHVVQRSLDVAKEHDIKLVRERFRKTMINFIKS